MEPRGADGTVERELAATLDGACTEPDEEVAADSKGKLANAVVSDANGRLVEAPAVDASGRLVDAPAPEGNEKPPEAVPALSPVLALAGSSPVP